MDALRHLGVPFSTDPLDTGAARRDLWPRATLEAREGRRPPAPAAVVWPRNAREVRATVAWARNAGVPVVPYGAGSGVCGGAAGIAGAITLDLKRMAAVRHFDQDARVVMVEPGMLGQHLEAWLAHRGATIGHSPSSILCSTVGGWAAARSAGQFSSFYGVFDDMLLAATAESPAGPLLGGGWSSPHAEDPLPLLCGSEGTLGIFTSLAIRTWPLAPHRWLRAYAFPHLEAAWDAMRSLMQGPALPFVLRLYDAIDTRIGGPARKAARAQAPARPGPGWLQRLREAVAEVPALHQHLLEPALALPRFVNRIAGHIGDEVLLVVGFEGQSARVDADVAAAAPVLARGRDLGAAPGEYWYAHRHEVSYKLAPVFAGGGWADTMEVAAPWSRLDGLHKAVRAALGRRALVMAHFSHAYAEGCSIYFSFVGRGGVDVYDATWADGLAAAAEAGGTVTHHHGVGQLKARAATREWGAAARIFQEARAAWDPSGILNPGRVYAPDAAAAMGPPPPAGAGPVYALDATAHLAEVDPAADPAALAQALASRGYALRVPPDRPPAAWLTALRRGAVPHPFTPLFAVQVRFPGGAAARLGPAPRSAAGPDLRWAALRRGHAEMVQLPVVPLGGGAPRLALPVDPLAAPPLPSPPVD
jgi:alkyldihydroxyacetonephosphate synthase